MTALLGRFTRGIIGATIYGVGVVTLFTTDQYEPARGAISLALILLQLLRIVIRGYSDSLTIVLSVTAIVLYAIPGSAVVVLLGLDVLPPVLMFIAVSDVMRAGSLRDPRQNPTPLLRALTRSRRNLLTILLFGLLLWCSVAGFLSDTSGFLGLFLFIVPYSASLVVFERLLAAKGSLFVIIVGVIAFLTMVAVYITFHWSGFGRLVVGAFVLAPLLIINYYRDIGLRVVAIVLVTPISLYFAQLSRYGAEVGSEDLLIGSAGHHLIVTNDVLEGAFFQDFDGLHIFFSQYALLFFNWIPRLWWPEKPLGAGIWSVDVIYGRAGYGEGYSQSLGFLGELYLYLGSDFWIGAIISIGTLLLVRRIIARLSYGFIAPLVIFDVNLISYFWGGMATFGSRTWFMLIPAIVVAWWLNRRQSIQDKRTVCVDQLHQTKRL